MRLKGGDPLVFGRGGEEALFLKEKGIPYEIVPGLTAGIAAPAYAGIPITMRGVSASFACITGHRCPGSEDSPIRWKQLAEGVDTIIVYMGLSSLPRIAESLISAGKSPDTPVAVIHWGSVSRQITITGTLRSIDAKVEKLSISTPVTIIIGEVVKFRESIQWFENLMLFGEGNHGVSLRQSVTQQQ